MDGLRMNSRRPQNNPCAGRFSEAEHKFARDDFSSLAIRQMGGFSGVIKLEPIGRG